MSNIELKRKKLLHDIRCGKMNSKAKRNLRKKLFHLQHGICSICFKPMDIKVCDIPDSQSPNELVTRDHVYPVSMTEDGSPWNILLAHYYCNHEKGSREPTPEELAFHALVRMRDLFSRGDKRRLNDSKYDIENYVTFSEINNVKPF